MKTRSPLEAAARFCTGMVVVGLVIVVVVIVFGVVYRVIPVPGVGGFLGGAIILILVGGMNHHRAVALLRHRQAQRGDQEHIATNN